MWVYMKLNSDDGGYYFAVGFMLGKDFNVVATYATEAAAAKRVHYLNGGNWEGREDETR